MMGFLIKGCYIYITRQKINEGNELNMPKELWGVDSAARVTNQLYNCVVDNFGKPSYWGRYLTTIPNVSDGLTQQEINLLQGNNVKIMPIFNNFDTATGYREGRTAAINATYNARRLGIPTGTFIFANVERFFDVDEGWIRGWVDVMYSSGFRPGIYADPSTAKFNKAYCTAVSNDAKVGEQVVIWSQEPTPGPTAKNNAPSYKPIAPPCVANVWAWQYGENAEQCPIDTNLIEPRLFEAIW
jgi:hypothetical protein